MKGREEHEGAEAFSEQANDMLHTHTPFEVGEHLLFFYPMTCHELGFEFIRMHNNVICNLE